MEPVSVTNLSAAYQNAKVTDTKAAGKEPPKTQEPRDEAGKQPLRPDRDEYIPERKWPTDKEPSADSPKSADAAKGPKKVAANTKEKTCTGSTDKVDREIEKLKKEKAELEKQLASETDERKIARLEKRLAQVENELRQKDTDAYRRQHMTRSFS